MFTYLLLFLLHQNYIFVSTYQVTNTVDFVRFSESFDKSCNYTQIILQTEFVKYVRLPLQYDKFSGDLNPVERKEFLSIFMLFVVYLPFCLMSRMTRHRSIDIGLRLNKCNKEQSMGKCY